MRWKFVPDGVELSGGPEPPEKFKALPIKKDAVEEFAGRVHTVRNMYTILVSAKEQFSSGQANYQNAAENLAHLCDEIDKVQASSIGVAQDVGVFFEPAGIGKRFDDAKDLLKFVLEVLDRLDKASRVDAGRKG